VNLPAAITSATYNANNQLTNWNGSTLSYDLNGNMTYDGATTYTWDARNRLGAFGSTTFAYDSFGRRTRNATGIAFLYDGANAVQELSGSTVTANLLTGGVDEIFTRADSAGTRNFLGDALGSTLALTDSTGTVQTQYSYEPFGKTTATGSASSSTFQYTGRENDGTGMYYYLARYYNPTLGRFISEDPAGFGGGDANFYVYAGNGPADYIDPSGESRKDCDNACDPFGPPGPPPPFGPPGLPDLPNPQPSPQPDLPSCFGDFIHDWIDGIVPWPRDPSSSEAVRALAEDLAQMTKAKGWAYAAGRVLPYPMRSSTFRGWMTRSAILEKAAGPGFILYEGYEAWLKDRHARQSGECQPFAWENAF
jgi:RHS repeat-associated protein